MRFVFVAVVLAGLCAEARAEGKPADRRVAAAPAQVKRELKRRTLTIDDSTTALVPDIHVAGGVPTVITFPVGLREGGAFVADVKGQFYPLQQNGKTVILVPKSDVPSPVALNVTTEDGTVMSFKLFSVAAEVDVQVDVVIALNKRASPDSPAALRASINLIRGQLDECQANSGNVGQQKIAALILSQNPDQSQAFDRRKLSGGDRQNRLLVEALWEWKMFGLSYVLFRVDNRDPTQPWTLERVDIKTGGGGTGAQDLKISSFVPEFPTLSPDTSMKIVVAYTTPNLAVGTRFTVLFTERDGNRHVKLDNLEF